MSEVFGHPLVEVALAYLVLLSLLIVVVDFVVVVPFDVRLQMYVLDLAVVLVLFLDLLVRAFRSGRPLSYLVFHFYEVVALVPLYLIYLVEASSVFGIVRALRFIRLARLIVLSARGGALFRAFLETSRSLQASTVIGALASTVLVAAITVYFAESGSQGSIKSFWDALWWAFATVTTVGYGDVVPQSGLGKAVGVMTMIVGIGVYSALIGIIAASLASIARRAGGAEDLVSRVEKLGELSEEELEELIRDIRRRWSEAKLERR
ncbi:MAG: potassium channel family protein [Thermoprotei archaeon]|nr:potassium channel family protein [Thermoprotei archaeon]